MRPRSQRAGTCCAILFAAACTHYTPAGARTVGDPKSGRAITEAEVQQDVQRFAGRFIGQVGQASEIFGNAPGTPQHDRLLRRVLMYESSAIDIATGPLPMVNLLDMIVFLSLSRSTFDEHWLPTVFGEPGRPLADALQTSNDEIWQVADKVLSEPQQAALRELIEDWRRAHPNATHVEAVRLSAFAEQAGDSARAKEARGLLASVTSAAKSADDAVLLGERAMFLALRVPFLMRLQMRLSAREIVSDSIERARILEPMLAHAKSLEPMLRELADLTANTKAAAAETRQLIESIRPVLATLEPLLIERAGLHKNTTTGLEETLDSANQVAERALPLVRELRALVDKGDPESLRKLNGEVDQLVRRWLFYVFLVGSGWTLLFWSGYVAFRRLTAQKSLSKPHDPQGGAIAGDRSSEE